MPRQTEVKSKGRPRKGAVDKSGLAEFARSNPTEDYPIYKDNYAVQSMKPIDMRDEMKDQAGWGETFEEIQKLHTEEGMPLEEASRTVRKSQLEEEKKTLIAGDLSQAVFVTDQVVLTANQNTPLASEVIPRRAVDEVTIRLDDITDVGTTSTHPEEGPYHEGEADFRDREYSVFEYSTKRKFTDKARLSLERYDVQNTKISIAEESMLQYEEKQILRGTKEDASGWDGLYQFASNDGELKDATGDSVGIGLVRDLITELRDGQNDSGHVGYDDMLCVVDVKTFRQLKDDLDDIQRFEPPTDARRFEFGLQALEIDGVEVIESDGIPSVDGSREMYVYDTSVFSMYHLADHTLQPLPREDTKEVFALYAIGVFASHAPSRVAAYENIGA